MNLTRHLLNHSEKERFKNFFRQFENIFFFFVLQSELGDSRSVLDVGCGNDSPIGRINKKFISEGIDVYRKCIDYSKKNHFHDSYKLGDVRKLSQFYKPKSFDVAISIDVIEHLTKPEANRLITDMERVARKKIILMTPRGYIDQKAYDGNPFQKHHSGWEVEDLKKLGYRVRGLRGWKFLRNDEATIRFSPWIFWGLCSFISEPLLYFFPELSFQIFAVKEFST